jgi:uncharacterized membrane protein
MLYHVSMALLVLILVGFDLLVILALSLYRRIKGC